MLPGNINKVAQLSDCDEHQHKKADFYLKNTFVLKCMHFACIRPLSKKTDV